MVLQTAKACDGSLQVRKDCTDPITYKQLDDHSDVRLVQCVLPRWDHGIMTSAVDF